MVTLAIRLFLYGHESSKHVRVGHIPISNSNSHPRGASIQAQYPLVLVYKLDLWTRPRAVLIL